MDLISNLHNDLQRGALQLVAAHRDTLFAEAKRLGCNDADADDLVMRTLDRALRKIDDCSGEANLSAWMKAILRNLHLNDLRSPVRRGTTPVDPQAMAEQSEADWRADEQLLRNSDSEALKAAIERLDPVYKQAVVMHYFGELPVKSIALALKLPMGTVLWRLSVARKILAKDLSEKMGRKPVAIAVILLAAGLLFGAGAAVVNGWLADDRPDMTESTVPFNETFGPAPILSEIAEILREEQNRQMISTQREETQMKTSTRNVFAAVLTTAMTSTALCTAAVKEPSSGTVFDDSRFWFYGGTDIDSSGVFKTGDFTDVFHAGNPTHELNQQLVYGSTAVGNVQAATTALEEIKLPMTGESKSLRVVTFPQIGVPNAAQTDMNYLPNSVYIGTAAARLCETDRWTVVWRLMRTGVSGAADGSTMLANMGYNYGKEDASDAKGIAFVVDKDGKLTTNTRHRGNSWNPFSSDVVLPKGEWIDLAFVMKGSGWNASKGRFDGATSSLYYKTANGEFTELNSTGNFWGDMSIMPYPDPTSTANRNRMTMFSPIRFEGSTGWLSTHSNWGLEKGMPVKFQQIAIWNRDLTATEVREAFGQSNGHAQGTGRFDGSADDLGGGKVTAYTVGDAGDWSGAPSVIAANSQIAYTFMLAKDDPSYAFIVGTAAGSPTGDFTVFVNGTEVATKRIVGGGCAVFVAKPKHYLAGENVITLRRNDSGADIALDAVRVVSTWSLGVRNNSWNEFGDMGQVGGSCDVRTVTDLKKVRNGIRYSTTWPQMQNSTYTVPFDKQVVENCKVTYTVPMTAWGNLADYPGTIRLYVNGVEKLSVCSTDIAGAWTEIKATFEPGELKAGANDFKWNITGTSTDNSPTIGFDCHVFEIEPEKRGMIIVVQ